MLPLKLSMKGDFLSKIAARKSKWQGSNVASKIRVPDSLKWWYWQEFGTASRGDPGRASGSFYEIDPVNAEALRFPYGGEIQYRDHVDHPGIKPRRPVTRVLPVIRRETARKIREALRRGAADDPALVGDALYEAMKQAKTLIVRSFAKNVPGTRELEPERGKLGGQTAAQAFEEQAQVIPPDK